jgi:cystathionine beta-lyase
MPVIEALARRVEHGVFGYGMEDDEFKRVIVQRLSQLYGWSVEVDQIVFISGVIHGFNWVCHAVTQPGDGVLIQVPVYPPFFSAAKNSGLQLQEAELVTDENGEYRIDFESFERAIQPNTKLFIMSNPHNPVGRAFRRDELEKLAEICLRHNIVICSDEIHCDLIFPGHQHIPVASLNPEISKHTVTLMAPSKTFNIAGLDCSFAIVQDEELRDKMQHARMGLVKGVNILGMVAGQAAYQYGQPWLDDLMVTLTGNRDFLFDYVAEHFPGIRMARPEATYLAWLDCRQAGIPGSPYEFFLKQARVALNEGEMFGSAGKGFVRLNFGCPRQILEQALERMRKALETI